MLCVPTARLEMLRLAVVRPPTVLSGPPPMLVAPSKNDTVPPGLATALLPGEVMVTLAVKVTACPETDALTEELAAVLVPALMTDCPFISKPLLAATRLSPL